MSSWQVEVSRSMADWASSGSVMSGSHSLASRLDVTTVEAFRWSSVMIS